jgi:small subunit ribosomal protein S16
MARGVRPGRRTEWVFIEAIMAVSLRLVRFGRRNRACFRLRAADSRFAPTGRFIEDLGWLDPVQKDPKKQASLDKERIEHWLDAGAKVTATVQALLKSHGIGQKKER